MKKDDDKVNVTFDKRDVHLDEAAIRAARREYRQLIFDADKIKGHKATIHFVLAIKDNCITYYHSIITDNEATRIFLEDFISRYVLYPCIDDVKNLPPSLKDLVVV